MQWWDAARKGDVTQLEAYLAKGQAVDEKGSKGRTALLMATENGRLEAVRLMLARGANPNVHAKGIGRPLTVAVENRHWDVAAALLDAGADPNHGGVAHTVISRHQPDLLRRMLEHGLDPNGKHKSFGPYVVAAIDAAVREEVLDEEGVSIGSRVTSKPDTRCLDLLLESGADQRAAERGRESSLLMPLVAGAFDLIRQLVAAGADLNLPVSRHEDKSLLMWAAASASDVEAIRVLVELGADLEQTDKLGRTAMKYAEGLHRAEDRRPEAVAVLRELGARPHAAPVDAAEADVTLTDLLPGHPFPARRGTLRAWDYNDWEARAVHVGEDGLEALAATLAAVPGVGLVDRDATAAALGGTLDAPDAPYLVVVKLKGHAWAPFATSWTNRLSTDDAPGQVARETGRKVIHAGHNDTASATFFTLLEGERKPIEFGSCGEEYGAETKDDLDDVEFPTQLRSASHPPDWYRQHADENETLQALVREQDAYLPAIGIGRDEKTGKVRLWAFPEDTLEPANVAQVLLAVYGPADAARPNPAGQQLRDAIHDGDAERVRAAVAAGAGVRFLPGLPMSPLALAVQQCEHRPERLAVVRALIEAGADPNDGGPPGPPIHVPFDLLCWEPHQAIPVLSVLLDGGADVNARSPRSTFFPEHTPLHRVVTVGHLATVQFLHARGADLLATDDQGRTPRALAEHQVAELARHAKGRRNPEVEAVIEYLVRAEAGAPRVREWEALMVESETKQARRAEELKQTWGQIAAAIQEVGEAMAAAEAEPDEVAVVREATAAQPTTIHLRKDSLAEWPDPERFNKVIQVLLRRGFAEIGTFVVDEFPGLLVYGLVQPDAGLYAAMYEMPGRKPWVDVVRFHSDGTSVSATNAETTPPADVDRPGHRKVRQPVWLTHQLADHMLAEPAPVGATVVPVTRQAFAERFERYYAEEMAFRARAAGVADDELRAE